MSAPYPARKRSRPPSRHLPRGLDVPSPETFDANVAEIQQMFGFSHDVETVAAALYHASNSVQLAANALISGGVAPLPALAPVRHPAFLDARYAEPPAAVQLRNLLVHRDGFGAVLTVLRMLSPGLSGQVEANALPLLTALGIIAVRSGAGYQVIANAQRPAARVAALPRIERLTRLGYRLEDAVRAVEAGQAPQGDE
jgi:hypothetical protein